MDDSAGALGERQKTTSHCVGWSVRSYAVTFVAVLLVATIVGLAAARSTTASAARSTARADAQFAADAGGAAIDRATTSMRTTVEQLAATPGLADGLATPEGCSLTFGSEDPFHTGHIDLLRVDGAVACSSLDVGPEDSYAAAPWFAAALREAQTVPVYRDPRTGAWSMVVAEPIPGGGVVAVFADLAGLGTGLSRMIGGPRHLEIVVTTGHGESVVTRSVDPERWVGASIAATPFAGESKTRDVDGTERIYAHRVLPSLAWTLHAGADEETALAASDDAARREAGVVLFGLLFVLTSGGVVYRRIAHPLRHLSDTVRAATDRIEHADLGEIAPLPPSTPAEISSLGRDFTGLLTKVDRELNSASLLAAALQTALDPIITIDASGSIIEFNPAAEQVFGYERSEAIGVPIASLIAPVDDSADALSGLAQVVSTGSGEILGRRLEVTAQRRDGTALPAELTITRVDWRGEPRFTAYFRDLTALRASLAEQDQLEVRLQQSQRLESLGQLAGGIAHDFNNLLSVIINYALFIEERVEDLPEVAEDVRELQGAAARAAALTQQLLIFGRRERVVPQVLDLNVVVADIHRLLQRSIGEHVSLVVHDEAVTPIRIDRGQLEQVLVNLAVNARDAMPRGGTLTLETRDTELDANYTHMHPGVEPGHYVELAVSDTGTGMAPEIVTKVFEPFFSTKPVGEGTGLGLATVHGIITQAGGSVSVYSELGVGTTIRAYLPAVPDAISLAHPVSETTHSGNGEVVLVVEDETAVRKLTTRMLERNGYVVIEADHTDHALDLARTHHVDVLLTDLVMPQRSGVELADLMREGRPGLRVIFMSGYSAGILDPVRAGIDQHVLIHKPFTERVLLAAIERVLTHP